MSKVPDHRRARIKDMSRSGMMPSSSCFPWSQGYGYPCYPSQLARVATGLGSSGVWDQGRGKELCSCWGSALTWVIAKGKSPLSLNPAALAPVSSRPGSHCSSRGRSNGMFNKGGSELAESLGALWPWELKAFFSGMRR